jgi:hypothetical protein
MKQRLRYLLVWIRRISHCRGFGIQSPNDYWFVRYVINEPWPYYQYQELGEGDDWLAQKLGRLCFRLANWRQPKVITASGYQQYFQAGCRKALLGDGAELVHMVLEGDWRNRLSHLYYKVDAQSVLIVEGIWRNMDAWRSIVADERTGVTFDLYYCGIVLFDKKRTKKNYIINF